MVSVGTGATEEGDGGVGDVQHHMFYLAHDSAVPVPEGEGADRGAAQARSE